MMEWLDSLWAWIMSLLASFVALFTSVTPFMEGAVASDAPSNAPSEAPKAAEVFEALAAHVPPMMVELAAEGNAPPNM